jgi:hypothetical protein
MAVIMGSLEVCGRTPGPKRDAAVILLCFVRGSEAKGQTDYNSIGVAEAAPMSR